MSSATPELSLASAVWRWGHTRALRANEGKALENTQLGVPHAHEETRHRGLEPPTPLGPAVGSSRTPGSRPCWVAGFMEAWEGGSQHARSG